MRNIRSTRWGRSSLLVLVAMLATLLVPFASPASANHGNRKLDATPETDTKGVGGSHTITARLCNHDPANVQDPNNCDTDAPANQSSGSITIRFENEGGANDPDNGTSRNTPDRTCHIFPVQADPSECSISYVGQNAGTDTWRVWIDHDGDASTVEADTAEGRNEDTTPGAAADTCGSVPGPAEPDCTDVVQVTWSVGGPQTLDCDDANGPDTERETNPSGGPQSNETYTCQVRDAQGNLTGDADPNTGGDQAFRVHGEVENGVNDPQQDGATYASEDYGCQVGRPNQNPAEVTGQCTITVTQAEGETGTAEICFWVDGSNNTSGLDESTGQALCTNEATDENQTNNQGDTGNDLADQTEKTWEQRTAAQGGLDAEPESDTNNTGDNHDIVATAYDQFGNPVSENNTINFEWFAGSPKDTDGTTPGTPDEQCLTVNASSCAESYTSSTPGRDLVCVWINATPNMVGNNQNGTCDGEGVNDADDDSTQHDQPQPVNDDVDVVSKTWVHENPATELNCEPENATTERTDNHVITCTATNDNGGVAGTNIDVEARGASDPDGSSTPGSPDFSCTTDNDGDCQVTHNGGPNNTLGVTTYEAWIDTDYWNNTHANERDESEDVDESTPEGAGGTPEPDSTDEVRNTWIADDERTISLDSAGQRRREGRRMRFFGSINGDPNCQDAETVRLRRRNAGTARFRTIATTVTDNNGNYNFSIVIRNTADYKAIAPATTTPDACDKAVSNVVTVRVRR